jgi:hypothetical protein
MEDPDEFFKLYYNELKELNKIEDKKEIIKSPENEFNELNKSLENDFNELDKSQENYFNELNKIDELFECNKNLNKCNNKMEKCEEKQTKNRDLELKYLLLEKEYLFLEKELNKNKNLINDYKNFIISLVDEIDLCKSGVELSDCKDALEKLKKYCGNKNIERLESENRELKQKNETLQKNYNEFIGFYNQYKDVVIATYDAVNKLLKNIK